VKRVAAQSIRDDAAVAGRRTVFDRQKHEVPIVSEAVAEVGDASPVENELG